MYKVYVTDHVFENFDPETKVLKELDCQLTVLQCKSSAELIEKAADADALLTLFVDPVDGAVMDAMPNLKVIVRYGIGYDTIDLSAASKRGIQVANVPDYCLDEVSDHAVALALSLVRKVAMSDKRVKDGGEYNLKYIRPMLPLRGARVGVVGFGRIGSLIGQKLRAFGCDISFCDPMKQSDVQMDGFIARKVSFDDLLADSDIIILQAPMTPENYHLLGEAAFGKMKRKPYIVNCARGELIDERALIQALEDGVISGAGLDVSESMPPVDRDNALIQFENVILTPHSAWVSEDSFGKLQTLAAMEVARALRGEPVKSLLNPQVLAKVRRA